MTKLLVRFALVAAAFGVTYYVLMLILGYMFDYASQHGYIHSDNDIGRGVLWAIILSVALAVLAAVVSLRLTRHLYQQSSGRSGQEHR